ncbi:MAG: nitroreductase [Deltaproteobacteria bacterium]|nr:nitroreductase [Deltaproteobacteria bacterium]
MDSHEAILARHSARAFRPEAVPREVLERVFTLAQRAPSWCNIQPWRVCVTAPEVTRELSKLLLAATSTMAIEPDFAFPTKYPEPYSKHRRECGAALYGAMGVGRDDGEGRRRAWLRNYEIFDAPHAAVVSMDRRWGTYPAIDVGVWLGTLLVAMTAEGLAACPQAALAAYPSVLRELLHIPADEGVLFGIALGFEDGAAPVNACRTTRSPLAENVRFVGF